MTAVDNVASLRQRREETVKQHIEAENGHDIEATIATFHCPRYEVNGVPSDGKAAVGELLQGLMHGMSDLHAESVRLRHMDDGVLVEGIITGTHDGEWAGIPPSGNRLNFPVVGIFEFDGDRLLCEKVLFDMATVLTQMGASRYQLRGSRKGSKASDSSATQPMPGHTAVSGSLRFFG